MVSSEARCIQKCRLTGTSTTKSPPYLVFLLTSVCHQFSLRGRYALVTGGNQGIGLALATGLAKAGAHVLVFDISPPSADFQSISAKYNVRTEYRMVDVSSVAALRQGFEETARPFCGSHGLHICLVVAGVNHLCDFLQTKESDFDRLAGINIKGVYFTCQLAARAMLQPKAGTEGGKVSVQGGKSIVVISSTAAYVATRTHNSSVYAATKSAVKGMVPELAKELGPLGIRVNSISPGYTLTNMTRGYPNLIKQWEKDTMLNFIGTPEDYVGAAIYLTSDASRYVTGQDLLVDGGTTKW